MIRIITAVVAVTWVLSPSIASAQVFKCLSPTNALSIQSQPCQPSWSSETISGSTDFELIIRAYDDMKAKLRTGDIEGALSHFTESARPRHRKIFSTLANRLPDATDGLGRVVDVTFG